MPTIGKKQLEVSFFPDVTPAQIQTIKDRFSSDSYKIEEKNGSLLISGYSLSDAVMNEVRSHAFIRDAKLLPHWAEKYLLAKKINLGLDLQGGMELVLRANYEKMEKNLGRKFSEKDKKEISVQALDLIHNRIDKFGVSEPSIRLRGTDAIEIQLPGVRDPQAVKKTIGTTGRVEYRLVDEKYSQLAMQWFKENKEPRPKTENEQTYTLDKISDALNLSKDFVVLFYCERDQVGKVVPAYPIVLERKVSLAGSDISQANVGYDEYGRLGVHFTTTSDGATKFATVTGEPNHGKRMAIVIDDKVRSAPMINVTITSGKAIIQGDFSNEEVNMLARIIKEGALPVDLDIVEERTVGPSLGQDSIEAGVKAFVVALVVIMAFMVFYYKSSGLIADACLIFHSLFLLAILSWLGFTLTLPGIAGFILDTGMAVDANVIFNERIKEEMAAGKSFRSAIDAGYERGFWTVFDSNITTIIAAVILSQVGSGPIKGFAITLTIGIICSMFSSIYISRFMFEFVASHKAIKKLSI